MDVLIWEGAQGAGMGDISLRSLCWAGVWGSALRRMPAWEAGTAASPGHQRGQAESVPLGKNGQCVYVFRDCPFSSPPS